MQWIKSGIENPLKSEVIDRCGGDEKTNDDAEPTKSWTLKNKKVKKIILIYTFIKGVKEMLLNVQALSKKVL